MKNLKSDIKLKIIIMAAGLILAVGIMTADAASIVGVVSGAGAGVIGGSNSSSLSQSGAAVFTASGVRLNPNGAVGASVTVSEAGGQNTSTPNADGGYLAGALGLSGAAGINTSNAVSGGLPTYPLLFSPPTTEKPE